jgi:uncharacterized membrane protein YqjE
MKPTKPASVGYLASLRSLGDGLLATVQERVELFTLELQEEKLRLVQTFAWAAAAFSAGLLAVTFGSLTLVYLFWDTARLAVLGGLTAFYSIALLGIIIAFRRYLARQPAAFRTTCLELKEDRAWIRNGH